MSEIHEQHGELPQTPRHTSAQGKRHAWGELRVRFWWLCAAAIAALTLIFTGDRIVSGLADRKLIREGKIVEARILSVDGITRTQFAPMRDDTHRVKLSAEIDGRTVVMEGSLPPGPGLAMVGGTINVCVDPKNPAHWTDRTEVTPWAMELIVPIVLLPLIVLPLGVAMLRRRQVLRVWRDGTPLDAQVVAVKQSAIAPLSRLVEYTIPMRDKRVYSMLVPAAMGVPEVGDVITVVARPDAPHRAVLAKLYM